MVAMGAVLALSLAAAGVYAFMSSPDEGPIVVNRSDLVSPDKAWVATLETVDNGLGFGQGMLYDEIHVRRPDEAISDHGDQARSAVFYVEAMSASGERPRMTWHGPGHLVIVYDKARSTDGCPGKRITQLPGMVIEYRTADSRRNDASIR